MADKKISALTDLAATPAADDQIPIVDKTAGETKRVDYSDLNVGIADVVDDTGPQLGGDLDMNDKNIKLKMEPGSDDLSSGLIVTMTVDTNAEGIGAPLFMAVDGHLDTADATASTTSPCVALALEEGTGSKKVLLHGVMRNDGWNWTTGPGKVSLIYLNDTVGTLTQTQPSDTDDVIQPVGYALSDDVLYFCPSMIYFTHT